LIQFKIRNRLPLVRRNEPLFVFPATTEVYDEFGHVVVEGVEDGGKAVHGESGRGKKIRSYYYLLCISISIKLRR
jgi:hypothetical protein